MSAARKVGVVSWTKATPISMAPPSWIGKRVTPVAAPVAPIDPSPRISGFPAPTRMSSPPPSFRRPSGSLAAVITTSAREVELEGHVAMLTNEVARLNDALVHAKTQILTESEPEIVRLAMAVAKRVVGRELSVDPELLVSFVKEGILALPGQAPAVIAAAPDAAAMLPREAPAGVETWNVVVDRSLAGGAVEVREGNATVGVGLDARLASLADALGVDEAT